ncbi:MAG TPA: phosphatidylglycerophosphatase A [Bacteroidia bacterium]|nr:phosphatidylglycerophosphatase A [Bacteroidia bacterium]HQW22162.1 phosphatidylglycerophosphatase A [Bacteroidia bacterium]
MFKRLSRTIATLGPIGYLPKAPGTWGSMTGAFVWYLAHEYISGFYNFQLFLVISAAIVGIIVTDVVSRLGYKDPKEVVIDELVGMWIALTWLPHSIKLTIIALILFRIFDIAKPFGIRRLEKVSGGWGIMLDDIAAGIASALILHFTLYLI